MSNTLDEIKDRLSKIPAWGYAGLAVGVLALTYFRNKNVAATDPNAAVGQTIYGVNPTQDMINNDSENRMQTLYTSLDDKFMGQTTQIQSGLDTVTQQIQDLNAGLVQVETSLSTAQPVTIPDTVVTAPAPVIPLPTPVTTPAPSAPVSTSVGPITTKSNPTLYEFLRANGMPTDNASVHAVADNLGMKGFNYREPQKQDMIAKLKANGVGK